MDSGVREAGLDFMSRPNFPLHWTGSSRLSLLQLGGRWRLLPASELRRSS